MAAFSDQSRDSVADYVTSLDAYASPDSADVLTIAWDYFSRQNSLALHTTTPLATLDVGQCAALLPVDFECNGRIRGSGNDGDYINQLQGMEISPESLLFSSCNAFSTINLNQHSQSTPTSHTSYPSSCTTSSHRSSLASLPPYSDRSAKSTNDCPQSYPSLEDSPHGAAQEDKRQRNTAASARFRVKKKQRDQALERSVEKVQDKIARLKADIVQLEIENKWLRDLATRKMEKNGDAAAGSKEGVEGSDD